jgi:peroxiredoxin
MTFAPSTLVPYLGRLSLSFAILVCATSLADDGPHDPNAKPDALVPGHSQHAEVFNEGPRQAAYLMPGMPKTKFPVTTSNPQAQQFVEQGVGQLHGFWFFEAERSFRQAAALDKNCGMAYWGMAMANIDNADRARKLMAECQKHKTGLTERETMYIDGLDAFLKVDDEKKDPEKKDAEKKEEAKTDEANKDEKSKGGNRGRNNDRKKRERAEAYVRALENILYKYPDDIEAKALLALQIWKNKDAGVPLNSFLAVDALLGEVFTTEPMHPAHHFRIHLWDGDHATKALASAALCGQSSPGIAHMWHMPGHTYSKLNRYDDACWQQEASARVDHAHMMRDRVLPDQIHNYAHNNEWLIRDMIFVGRIGDALALAKNMCELPRHPKYNTPSKGSASFGRQRLQEVLTKYELWDELIALSNSPYLEAGDKEADQLKRLRMLGMAHYRKGDTAGGELQLAEVQRRLDTLKAEQAKAEADAETKAKEESKSEEDLKKAKEEARKPLDERIKTIERALEELQGHQAIAVSDFAKGHELLKKAGGVDEGYLAIVQQQAGKTDEAIKASRDEVGKHAAEVVPQAQLVEVLWRADKKDDARKAFEDLRAISTSIDLAANSPVFKRLEPIAVELGLPSDWRVIKPAASDVGVRPALDSLGPFRWQPSPASEWRLANVDGVEKSLAEYRGKPVVLLFFLGNGCLHCAEQIHAFGEALKQFEEAGIALAGISSDDREGLKVSIENYKGGSIPIPLLADHGLDTFKAYRCFDDFEQQPLHGAFLVDGEGKVRWQDIGFEPFMDHKFLLGEAKRLLGTTPSVTPVEAVSGE